MGKHSRVARHRIERPGNSIGRVGALALFLGVGGALASLPATASADTGTNDSTAAPSRGVRGDASQHAARTTRPAAAKPAAAVTSPRISLPTVSLPSAAVVSTPRPAASTPRVSLPAAAVASSPINQPAVATALVGAAKQVVVNVAGGGSLGTALQGALSTLSTDPALAGITLDSVLADPAMPQSWGQATGALVTGLAADPQVRAALAARLAQSITAALGNTASAAGLGATAGNALVTLLSDQAATAGLASVAQTFVTGLLSQPGVSGEVATVTRQLVAGLQGSNPSAALDSAWQSLQAGRAFRAGIGSAVTAAVNVGLTNAGLVNALGTAAAAGVSYAATDPNLIGYISDVVPAPYANAVLTMLADPASTARLASIVGSLVPGFLSQPGVAAGISTVAGQFATNVVAGANPTFALLIAVRSLQATPGISAALDTTITTALRAILSDQSMQAAVSTVARSAIVDAINTATANTPLASVAAPVVSAAVDSLLANTAVQNLISSIAGDIAGGTSPTALAATVIGAVIADPALQMAIGAAVGQGVGALLGANPVGAIVGQVVGAAATVLIGLASGLALLFNGFGLATPAAASTGDSRVSYSLIVPA